MNEMKAKYKVRERDNYCCRKCGVSDDVHVEQTGKSLEVHRLIPGMAYVPFWCVLLCHECHKAMPRRALDAMLDPSSESGLCVVALNLFHFESRRCAEAIFAAAGGEEGDLSSALVGLLESILAEAPQDFCI